MMKTFTFGTAPEEELDRAIDREGIELYPMSLVGEAAETVQRLVNQGIDSCLAACFMPSRGDSYRWTLDRYNVRRLECLVSPKSLKVLLRRLAEADDEEAYSLRTDILQTLNIEEV